MPDAFTGRPAPPTMQMPTLGMKIRSVRGADDVITIGVAIEVPEPYGSQLQRCRGEFGDPLATAIPTHVTLVPPTEITPGDGGLIEAHLSTVAARTGPFTVRLLGTGSFRPVSPVVYVSVAEGADGCDALQRSIRTGPLERDLPFPYHPHVTVAHHLPESSLDRAQRELGDFHAEFTVDSVALYEHGTDGVWRLRRHFPFG